MNESLITEETVRDYLLGRVSDETTLAGIEERLFSDEEFCSQIELAEDELINDYVFGRLNEADAESFRATLSDDPEKAFKLKLTQALREKALARNLSATDYRPSFFASIAAFFQQPKYVGAFAVLLIAVVGLLLYFRMRSGPNELAELRSIFQQNRPTESRISEFSYAPFSQLRGAPEPGDQKRLRRIENNLSEAAEKASNAQTHHALGVYYLTQRKYADAIREFESALRFAEKDARIHNDLGSAHFELAQAGPKEKRLEELAQSLEEFTKATELDANLLEALFNKSLALQELSPREAKESWKLYLQKDPASPWAAEARKHLAAIQSEQALFKSDEQVLADFLAAYRAHDEARAQGMHDAAKGLLRGPTVPLQLCRRYLEAAGSGNSADAKESLAALTFLGNFEQTHYGDSFFFELANFYSHLHPDNAEPLLQAHRIFTSAYPFISKDPSQAITLYERSRDLFTELGDDYSAEIAELWAAQVLLDTKRIAECRLRMHAMIQRAESRKFLILLAPAYYWLGMSDYSQGLPSESARNLKIALRLAESNNNLVEIQHSEDALAKHYTKLGELEPALAYASKRFSDQGIYDHRAPNQYLRDRETLAELMLKLRFWTTSLSLSKDAVSFARENGLDDVRLNDSLRHAASAALATKDFTGALQYANDSLQIALKRGESAEAAVTKAKIYQLLGDIKGQANNCGEALDDYSRALELYGRLPEMTVNSYQIHKGRLFCFQELGQHEQFVEELKTIMDLSEAYRRNIREDTSRQAFFDNEQDVFDAAIENALQEQDGRQAFAFVEASKARSLLEFVGSGKSIAEVEGDFASLARPLTLGEIQARLPEQVELIQYAVLPDRLAIWTLSKTRFDLLQKQISAVELEKKVAEYQTLIVARGAPDDIRRAGRELYDLLIPPDVDRGKQVCLSPDKSLHQLAFATLVSDAGKYLLEDQVLFYAPSASILVLATEKAQAKAQVADESLLSVGNPDFDREENPNLPDLQDAEAEATAIAGMYKDPTELLSSGATKEKFLLSFANVEVVHFAGHFVANPQSPANSKLLFAGGELRSSELGSYHLPKAKLVVMSACETGFERYNKSEGAIGIARTLLALGAPLVLASQWKVDSEPTKDLMIAFHRNRKQNGMTSAEGLRRAQLGMLGNDATKAPFYWAAFSLFGGYAGY
jgi:CHAT domain-containing protein